MSSPATYEPTEDFDTPTKADIKASARYAHMNTRQISQQQVLHAQRCAILSEVPQLDLNDPQNEAGSHAEPSNELKRL